MGRTNRGEITLEKSGLRCGKNKQGRNHTRKIRFTVWGEQTGAKSHQENQVFGVGRTNRGEITLEKSGFRCGENKHDRNHTKKITFSVRGEQTEAKYQSRFTAGRTNRAKSLESHVPRRDENKQGQNHTKNTPLFGVIRTNKGEITPCKTPIHAYLLLIANSGTNGTFPAHLKL